jgi:hypothetical protein
MWIVINIGLQIHDAVRSAALEHGLPARKTGQTAAPEPLSLRLFQQLDRAIVTC